MPLKSLTQQQLPKDEMPEAYKELQSVKMSENVDFKQEEIKKELPKTDLYKKMKKLSSFKKIKRSYKLEHQKQQFLSDLRELFKHLKTEEHQLDIQLLLELLNCSESYFVYGSKEEIKQSKHEVLLETMLPFFGNDENVLMAFVETISCKVKKSNLLRRLWRRVYNFFL